MTSSMVLNRVVSPPFHDVSPDRRAGDAALFFAHQSVRAQYNLKPFTLSPHLLIAARWHVETMVTENKLGHELSDGDLSNRLKILKYTYSSAGENIAYCTTRFVMDSWMNSPKHKQNILDPFFLEIGTATFQNFHCAVFGHALLREDSTILTTRYSEFEKLHNWINNES